MTIKEVLAQLKSEGDAARRKHNSKLGAPDNQFGVKHGDIRAIAIGEKIGLYRPGFDIRTDALAATWETIAGTCPPAMVRLLEKGLRGPGVTGDA